MDTNAQANAALCRERIRPDVKKILRRLGRASLYGRSQCDSVTTRRGDLRRVSALECMQQRSSAVHNRTALEHGTRKIL